MKSKKQLGHLLPTLVSSRIGKRKHETLALRRQVLVDMQKASDDFPESI